MLEAREKYKSKTHKSMAMPPKSIPPSIPIRKLPPNSYTGKRGDIPGPANYNPNHEITKTKQRVIDFSRRQKSREIFSNFSAKYPGPGVYDDKNNIANDLEKSANAKSSMFISKVPNCKGTKDDNGIPGPGSYMKKKKSLHKRANSYRVDPNGRGFMSSTKREGFWDNTLEAPFTKGTNKEDGNWPGKGPKKNKSRKGSKNQNSQALQQAFHSSEMRD